MRYKLYHAIYDENSKQNDYKIRFQKNDFIDYKKVYDNKQSVLKDLKILQFFRIEQQEGKTTDLFRVSKREIRVSKREMRLIRMYLAYKKAERRQREKI